MRNMLRQCQQAYAQTASEHSEACGRVVACTACYNWIMHRRQTLPFVTPVQILHWYLNTLSNTIPKKIDSRIISGVCHRLRGTQDHVANYYYSLFGANERSLIERIAQCKNARAVEGIVARYFFESCKASPVSINKQGTFPKGFDDTILVLAAQTSSCTNSYSSFFSAITIRTLRT
jgi:hypothetical protein